MFVFIACTDTLSVASFIVETPPLDSYLCCESQVCATGLVWGPALGQEPTEEELLRIVSRIDDNGNGKISTIPCTLTWSCIEHCLQNFSETKKINFTSVVASACTRLRYGWCMTNLHHCQSENVNPQVKAVDRMIQLNSSHDRCLLINAHFLALIIDSTQQLLRR